MLQHLLIKDLAVVVKAEISFSRGMTVITGETGAGKSILLDALSLALGERCESHLIRPGAKLAEIAAIFDISALPDAVLWLTNFELTQEDNLKQCIIRRILYPQGRSKAFINGRYVTTSQLRLLGEYLVEIHGQHQHQLLLKPQEQLRLLDAFGQHDTLVSQVRAIYQDWENYQQRKQVLLQSQGNIQSKMDLLQYQIAELDALVLGEHELQALYEEHETLAYAQNFIEATEHTLSLLESQEDTNVLQMLTMAQQNLRGTFEKTNELRNAKECLDNAHIQLKEAILEMNTFIQKVDINPDRLAEIERRLERIHDMARKHKVEPTQLYMHKEQLKTQAKQFSTIEETLIQLDRDLKLICEQYQQVAQQLTEKRKKAAQKLSSEVTTCIEQLAMSGAVFTVILKNHEDKQLHPTGNEQIQFGISANLGHAPQLLHKVASGGELSRLSLALELILSKYLATPCLIFDEVDVGISGKVGAIVGKTLFDLGKSAQVICITHLPQVAALGNHHLQVTKKQVEEITVSEIRELTLTERVEEIARMLGGMNVTSQAKAHAKQLMDQLEDG